MTMMLGKLTHNFTSASGKQKTLNGKRSGKIVIANYSLKSERVPTIVLGKMRLFIRHTRLIRGHLMMKGYQKKTICSDKNATRKGL